MHREEVAGFVSGSWMPGRHTSGCRWRRRPALIVAMEKAGREISYGALSLVSSVSDWQRAAASL